MILVHLILGSIYSVYFFICLVIFHVIQWISYNLFGPKAHQGSVAILNGFLTYGLHIAGTRLEFINPYNIPKDRPVLFIANHQSQYDIVGLIWFLRAYYPLFVAKKELSRGIPSISYNLRKSGAALIDRKDRKQAIYEILKLGIKVNEENRSVIIFPEGTRSKEGILRTFSKGGISALLKKMPEALIIPISISGTGNLDSLSRRFIKAFQKLRWEICEPFEAKGLDIDQIILKSRTLIEEKLVR